MAFMETAGSVLIRPRQLGPSSAMPASRACWRTLASSSAPSAPVSLKPAEMTMALWMPLRPHTSSASGTPCAGMMRTAMSTLSSMSSTVGYDLTPMMLPRFGFTG